MSRGLRICCPLGMLQALWVIIAMMNAMSTLTMPVGQGRRVLVRPVATLTMLGFLMAAAVGISVAFDGEGHGLAAEPWDAAILLVLPAIMAAIGGMQSLWWRHTLGPNRYQADHRSLRVLHRGAVLHEWTWSYIYKLRLAGGINWYSFLVDKDGASEFPHLVVYTKEGVTTAPGVLVWGRDTALEFERQLMEMHRARSQ